MIVYVTSNEKGQIFTYLEADVLKLIYLEGKEYAPGCQWKLITEGQGTHYLMDVVRMESDEGIIQTGIIVDEGDPKFEWDKNDTVPTAEEKVQSIPDGTPCIFDLEGMLDEFDIEDDALYRARLKVHDKTRCIVESLETYTELGDQDYEYYNIKFEDGFKMAAVSGYHLETTNWQ